VKGFLHQASGFSVPFYPRLLWQPYTRGRSSSRGTRGLRPACHVEGEAVPEEFREGVAKLERRSVRRLETAASLTVGVTNLTSGVCGRPPSSLGYERARGHPATDRRTHDDYGKRRTEAKISPRAGGLRATNTKYATALRPPARPSGASLYGE
jgi:hypothetical protein